MLGYLIVLSSSLFFCIQNVVVRVLFTEQPVIGLGMIGGYVPPTLGNSFLLLFLRMLLAVPLMAALSKGLHPKIWTDLWHLGHPTQRRALFHSLVGGGLMFAYLALLYLAVGLVPTGIAMTLFFTFPVFTALFSWGLFGSQPSFFHWGIMTCVIVGSVMTVPPSDLTWSGGSTWGLVMGVASGVAYALYTVNAQKAFEMIHPVLFTWMSFAVTLALAGLCLVGNHPEEMASLEWGPLWIGSLLSGLVTFGGHVLYNSGIRLVGATAAAMVGASNLAFTVVLAWFMIQETLGPVQVLGVILVTVSVAALSGERRGNAPTE
ncbi:DMT family transporter [Leptolyngbya sp. PCC 6406]|uniref:DMT family transporter n=1 Tax=Leptolyngbya sp. PCC 6406 TaxID=1173264 RepID=UPI0002AC34FF|nr:DMT family transporter [Leptolyngbya sp. PCC 6406]